MAAFIGLGFAQALGLVEDAWSLHDRLRGIAVQVSTEMPSAITEDWVVHDFVAVATGAHRISNLASPLAGRQELRGVPFLIPDGNKSLFLSPNGIVVGPDTFEVGDLRVNNPRAVHLILGGTYAFKEFDGQPIGKVELGFSRPGCMRPVALIAGYNVREDWQLVHGNNATVTTLDPTSGAANALMERQERGGQEAIGLVDVLTLQVPSDCRTGTLQFVRIVDTSETTVRSPAPGLAVGGITVERDNGDFTVTDIKRRR